MDQIKVVHFLGVKPWFCTRERDCMRFDSLLTPPRTCGLRALCHVHVQATSRPLPSPKHSFTLASIPRGDVVLSFHPLRAPTGLTAIQCGGLPVLRQARLVLRWRYKYLSLRPMVVNLRRHVRVRKCKLHPGRARKIPHRARVGKFCPSLIDGAEAARPLPLPVIQ
jgi:hypothetical protein